MIACHECDLLQREVALAAGGTARCARCGAVLYRNQPDGLDRTLACALGAAGYDALVAAHSRALAAVSRDIAEALRTMSR